MAMLLYHSTHGSDDPTRIEAALEAVAAGGGKTVEEKTVIPGMVTMAKFADPAGNVIGLIEEGSDG